MSEQHTKEPWRIGRHGCVVTDEPVPEISGSDDVEYYDGHFICESVTLRNARRIVACVNACAGIETYALELMTGDLSIINQITGKKAKKAEKLTPKATQYRMQRDALLTICEELAACAAYWSEYDVPLGIVDRLNAAIAKAKEGEA